MVGESTGQPAGVESATPTPFRFKFSPLSASSESRGAETIVKADITKKTADQSAVDLVKQPALQDAKKELSGGAFNQFSKNSNNLLTFVMNGDEKGYHNYVKLNFSDFKSNERTEADNYFAVLEKRYSEQMQSMRNFTEGLMTGDSNKVRQASAILGDAAKRQGIIDATTGLQKQGQSWNDAFKRVAGTALEAGISNSLVREAGVALSGLVTDLTFFNNIIGGPDTMSPQANLNLQMIAEKTKVEPNLEIGIPEREGYTQEDSEKKEENPGKKRK